MNPKLEAMFREYADYHRHPTNQLTHKVAIPLIVFHIIAMLNWVHILTIGGGTFVVTFAHLAFVAAIGWYLTLNVKLGVIMAVLFGLCFPLAALTPTSVVIAIAVVGWLVQLAGHVVWEKRSPAFLTNLLQALIGPFYFVAKITGDWKESEAARPVDVAGARRAPT
jgi:uncharacterized membrane protein YGL010W